MTESSPFSHDPVGQADEPLGLLLSERPMPSGYANARAHRFEFSSRGDRVSGRLLLPDPRSGPCALVVLLGDAGEDCDAANPTLAAGWIAHGFAIATLDLALHGERSSPKFSQRLLDAIAASEGEPALDDNGRTLLLEFTRQSLRDLARALDALGALPAIDTERIGIVGFGYGASLAAIFAADEPRVRAVLLARESAPALPACDPRAFVERIPPRALGRLDADASDGAAEEFLVKALAAD